MKGLKVFLIGVSVLMPLALSFAQTAPASKMAPVGVDAGGNRSEEEVESKYDLDEATYHGLKGLIEDEDSSCNKFGKKGKDAKGKKHRKWCLKLWREIKSTDIYYDTEDYRIYAQDGVLRKRSRYKDVEGRRFQDISFQAKNSNFGAAESNVYVRNEIQGNMFKDLRLWDEYEPRALLPSTDDPAMVFVRTHMIGERVVEPKVQNDATRFYIMVHHRGWTRGRMDLIPEFQLAVDRIVFTNLQDPTKTHIHYEAEVEIWDQLPDAWYVKAIKDVNRVNDKRKAELQEFSAVLEEKFPALKKAATSKFVRGIRTTINPDVERVKREIEAERAAR